MRTPVKWLAVATWGTAILLVLAVATVYAVSSYKLGKRHDVSPQATTDRENLEGFGRYLALAICTECHGDDLRGSSGFLTTPTLAVSVAYTSEQFRESLRTGIALGGRELEMMSAIARDRSPALPIVRSMPCTLI